MVQTGSAQEIKVTLLGTGTPVPAMNRFGPSILVEAGGADIPLRCRPRCHAASRPAQGSLAGRRWPIPDTPSFGSRGWLSGSLVDRLARRLGRDRPLLVWGPRGTKRMMSHLEQAYDFDIRIRLYDDRAAPEGVVILAEDMNEGVVFEKGGLTITAFEVDHTPVRPAFGFRVDYGGRSVVLSGDTRVSENLIRHAQGVDLLVHEVASPESFQRAGVRPERAKQVIAHHVTPEQAGEVFAKTKPRLAVYSHIVQADASEQDLIPPTRRTYSGAVEVGEDLMVILVGEKVEVRRPGRSLH